MGMAYSEMFSDSAERRARVLEKISDKQRHIRILYSEILSDLGELRDESSTFCKPVENHFTAEAQRHRKSFFKIYSWILTLWLCVPVVKVLSIRVLRVNLR